MFQMQRVIVAVILYSICFASVSQSQTPASDATIRAEFRRDYEKAAKVLIQANQNLRVVTITTVPFSGGGGQELRGEWKIREKSHVVVSESTTRFLHPKTKVMAAQTDNEVDGCNQQYYYRMTSAPGKELTLRKLTVRTTPSQSLSVWPPFFVPFANIVQSTTILDMLDDNSLRFEAYSDVLIDGQQRKQIVMTYDGELVAGGPKNSGPKNNRLQSTYAFSPEHSWVCVEYQLAKLEQGSRIPITEQRFSYDTSSNTFPVLKEVEFWNWRAGKNGAEKSLSRTMKVTEFESKQFPDEDFRLSAFGLSEPVGVVWVRPTPPYVWILVAATVCAVLAVLVRWFGGRKPKPATNP